jgi:DNA primase
MIDLRSHIDEIKRRVPIEKIVRDRCGGLKKSGSTYFCTCPFHQERSASFHVVPDKGFAHCFGCKWSGDVVKFIQDLDRLSFIEAVEECSRLAGMEFERRGSAEDREREVFEVTTGRDVRGALHDAATYWHKFLGDKQRAWVRSKWGITDEVIDKGLVGLACGGCFSYLARTCGYSVETILGTGLFVAKKQWGGTLSGPRLESWDDPGFDFFRNLRFTFPAFDVSGEVTQITARLSPWSRDTSDFEEPKYKKALTPSDRYPYVHSSMKSPRLFGEDNVPRGKFGTLFVVEGPGDALAVRSAGRPAIATFGTGAKKESLDRIEVLGKNADRIVMLFDADGAGRKAGLSLAEELFKRGLPVFVGSPLDVLSYNPGVAGALANAVTTATEGPTS